MAAITATNTFIAPLGPVKLEVVNAASVDDGDTYVTRIQRPLFACFIQNSDSDTTAYEVNCAISGRTITFNQSNLSADTGVLLVFGF